MVHHSPFILKPRIELPGLVRITFPGDTMETTYQWVEKYLRIRDRSRPENRAYLISIFERGEWVNVINTMDFTVEEITILMAELVIMHEFVKEQEGS